MGWVEWLAKGTEEGHALHRPLPYHRDCSTAAQADLPAAPVDIAQLAGGLAQRGRQKDLGEAVGLVGPPHHVLAGCNQAAKLVIAQAIGRSLGVDTRSEEDLGFQDIADARHDGLVHHRLANRGMALRVEAAAYLSALG